jgi:hypothetical protein
MQPCKRPALADTKEGGFDHQIKTAKADIDAKVR